MELAADRLDLLLVHLLDLVGFNLHLLELEQLVALLALGVEVAVLVGEVRSNLLLQVGLQLGDLVHESKVH